MGSGEKWLLLGASGFIGSQVSRAAEAAGVKVRGASRSAIGWRAGIPFDRTVADILATARLADATDSF